MGGGGGGDIKEESCHRNVADRDWLLPKRVDWRDNTWKVHKGQ